MNLPESLEEYWEAFSDGVLAIGRDLKIVSFSEGAERITGCRADEVVGQLCRDVFRSEMCGVRCPLEKMVETGEPVSGFRTEITGCTGKRIPISGNLTPLRDAGGRLIGGVLSFRDLGEVYGLAAELFKETVRLQSILNSIGDGVFTVDTEWRITSFNPSAERITGYREDEVLGRPCHFAFKSRLCGEGCPLRRTIETGEAISNCEMEIINAGGQVVPIAVSTALLIDEEGEIIGGVETFRDMSLVKRLSSELKERYGFANIVGKNSRMQEIYTFIETVSDSTSTILLQGETGTGKDLVARAVHYNSPRRDGPFVKVSCAALPETLLESELFGHKKGAFTGALKDRTGRFEAADGGTIFLDEIGEVTPVVQVKLLRVLEEQEFEPVGETRTKKVDVRIVAATNRDLTKAMEEGQFREDLYYRLDVVSITLPPLRERTDDIPLLVDHFVRRLREKTGKKVNAVAPSAMDVLLDYRWPGNVRQLENALEHAFVHCRGSTIQLRHLPDELKPGKSRFTDEVLGAESPLEELEKSLIADGLKKHQWSRERTAHALGISRTTLWRKMKRYGIQRP